jgi:hypothetical protein
VLSRRPGNRLANEVAMLTQAPTMDLPSLRKSPLTDFGHCKPRAGTHMRFLFTGNKLANKVVKFL